MGCFCYYPVVFECQVVHDSYATMRFSQCIQMFWLQLQHFYCVYYCLQEKHETTIGMMQGSVLSVKSYWINKTLINEGNSHCPLALTSVSDQTVSQEERRRSLKLRERNKWTRKEQRVRMCEMADNTGPPLLLSPHLVLQLSITLSLSVPFPLLYNTFKLLQ